MNFFALMVSDLERFDCKSIKSMLVKKRKNQKPIKTKISKQKEISSKEEN